jgi:hypothetical protein
MHIPSGTKVTFWNSLTNVSWRGEVTSSSVDRDGKVWWYVVTDTEGQEHEVLPTNLCVTTEYLEVREG